MTRRRWIADESSESLKTAALTGENARHLARVLRARVGQEYDLACGERVFTATIRSVAEGRVEFTLGGEVTAAQSGFHVTVFLAVFKFDRFEWAVEKLTELGVAEIVPLIASRTDAHLAAAAQKRVERWRRIAHEASQQSRRLAPPQIADPQQLKASIAGCTAEITKILLWEGEHRSRIADHLKEDSAKALLAVGPEGGWTDAEVALFTAAGWLPTSLGPTILRAETAAVAAMAAVNALL